MRPRRCWSGGAWQIWRGMPIAELAATPEDQIFWGQPTTDIAAGIHSHTWVRNMRSQALVPVDRRVLAIHAGIMQVLHSACC